MYPYDYLDYNDYLMHHGILGQKWGVRRFQNADGSLTAEGRKRYGNMAERSSNVAARAGKVAKVSGAVTAGIAAYDVAAILAGSSTILLPAGPAVALAASGAAYVASKLANKHANKKLENSSDDSKKELTNEKNRRINPTTGDKYMVDFIDAIQNSKMFIDGDDKAINKEYEKYLEDPKDYWENRKNKLPRY